MKKITNIITVFVLFSTLTIGTHAQNVREITRLDRNWKFAFGNASDPVKDFGSGTEYFNYLTKANSIHNKGPYSKDFNDSSWQIVNVPHDWVTTLPYAGQASHSHGYKTVGYKYPETSVGWYRKIIDIPESDLGKRIELRFDGIFRNATVWFNGFYMGVEPSGYATQVYDVTEYVNYGGENLICVRADATYEEGWFYEGAGIYRDVWLVKSAAVSVLQFGTFVYSDLDAELTHAVINIETEVGNSSISERDCIIEQSLVDASGNTIGKSQPASLSLKPKQTGNSSQQIRVDNPHLWNTDDPYLYKVVTTVSADGHITDIYETVTGIRKVEFDADKGFLLNGKQLKLKGVNMHQDHAGVGSAIPEAVMEWRIRRLKEFGCNAYRSSHNPISPALLDICDREGILVIDENRLTGINREHLRLLESMIRRDRNHPSVILWSNGNEEWGMENTVQGTRIAAAMREYAKLMDPTRSSTIANAGGYEMIKGLEVVGYNYIAQNDVENRRRQHPEWKIVGTEETTGCGTRGVYFNLPEVKGRMKAINIDNKRNGVENVIERGWKFYADHEWAAGVFYWTGFDYRGEPNPLSYPATDSEFGILDYCGFWKDEAWYLKSWWTDEPTLHIFPHWNLSGHEGEEIDIWAYSNCDQVELTVNGKKLGRQDMPRNGHLKWRAVYQPGKVVATGYKNGKKILTQTIETTKPASKINVKSDRSTIKTDGYDAAVITVEILDSKNRIVPDACPELTLSVEGDAEIIGAGNGDPSYLGKDNPGQIGCKEFSIPAFNGLAQFIIRSGLNQGEVKLTCSSESLQPGTLSILGE
ncbi:MAG: DUF4982 domain-containing protein [Bacteroidaceae bacterium]|nr:DUF4982 domain-containing protein [Bacteroidaceae bacterium]